MAKDAVININTNVKGSNRVWLAEVNVQIRSTTSNGEWYDNPIIYERTFSGSAIRNPKDRQKDAVGCQLALGRALQSAGQRLQKVAWANVQFEDEKLEKDSLGIQAVSDAITADDLRSDRAGRERAIRSERRELIREITAIGQEVERTMRKKNKKNK